MRAIGSENVVSFALRAPMSRRLRRATSARKSHPQIEIGDALKAIKLRGGAGKAA